MKNSRWLVAIDEGGTTKGSIRTKPVDPTYEQMRSLLESVFPAATIFSPLENSPKGSRVVSLYTSPNESGATRLGSGVYLWAVKEP